MGREIAYVMGYEGIDWLERSEREDQIEKLLFPEIWDVPRQIRQGPSGPAFRTRAGGALGTTGPTRSQ